MLKLVNQFNLLKLVKLIIDFLIFDKALTIPITNFIYFAYIFTIFTITITILFFVVTFLIFAFFNMSFHFSMYSNFYTYFDN